MLILFIASAGLAAILGVWLISNGGGRALWGLDEALLSTLGLLAISSILGFANCEVWDRRICHPLGPIGLAVTFTALSFTAVPIWGRALSGWGARNWWNSQDFWKASTTMWILAVCLADVGLLTLAQLHRKYFWLRRITIGCTLLFAALLGLFIFEDGYGNSSLFERAIPILGILVGFGTLGIHFLHRYSNLRKVRVGETSKLQIAITCPRCAMAQSVHAGRSACALCGLKFLIEIEENVCEKCGYSLYRLESSACPECGTPILQNPAPVISTA